MARPLSLICVPQDAHFASWLQARLSTHSYNVVVHTLNDRETTRQTQSAEQLIRSALAVIVVLSPDAISEEHMARRVTLARQLERPLVVALCRYTDPLPWYVLGQPIEDFTSELERPLQSLVNRLPAGPASLTFGEARDNYLQRASLKSRHTIAAYHRSIQLFFEFLGDRAHDHPLPIQQRVYLRPEEIPVEALSPNDAPIFLRFAEWLLSATPTTAEDRRPYKPSTTELRVAGVQNWFQFLDDHGWLPAHFQLSRAIRIVQEELRGHRQRSRPPRPPDNMEEVIYYYDNLQPPPMLRRPDVEEQRIKQWEMVRLRNRALLHSLAESGGRISDILSLDLEDFPERYLARDDVLRVEVTGKGGHTYYLRFLDALPTIRAYISMRGADLRASSSGNVPLFVSHNPSHDGRRMSRTVAWRVVQRASRALGLKSISPHDFRHWRATQLLNAGHSLDIVQEYLGHRSVETTRSYYAHTDPLRVDDAARDTRLPEPDDTHPPDEEHP